VTIVSLNTGSLPAGGGFLVTATFELRNHGDVDASVNCSVGNVTNVELTVPVNPAPPGQGGLFSSSIQTFTLNGVSTGGNAPLVCELLDWRNNTGPASAPDVSVRKAFITAQRIDQLSAS
jgi:hypothetical protein